MKMTSSQAFEDVKIGDDLPPLTLRVTPVVLVKYAAATWDFHPFHYNKDFVQAFGLDAPFADGQMFGALLARLLMSWAGGDAFVRWLRYRLRTMVFENETVIVRGRVSGKFLDDGVPLVSTVMSVTKDDGSTVIKDAEARVEMSSHSL